MDNQHRQKIVSVSELFRNAKPMFAEDQDKVSLHDGIDWIHIPFTSCRTHRELLDWRRKLSERPGIDDDQIAAFEKSVSNRLPRE